MKRLCKLLLIFFLMISIAFPVYATSSVPKSVINATESVVRVLAEYSGGYATGSGFVIKSDKNETLIVTNYHVVEGNPYSISIWLGDEESVSATILAYTSQKDMCILKLAYPVGLKPLAFAENGAQQGEAVYAVGFPGAADYLSDKEAHTSADATITDGIVSAVREATVSRYGTPTKILQINAAINSGNSGGPLFNANGEVVGINTYGINDSQGIFGAIDVSELKTFLADYSIPIPTAHGNFLWVILAASAVIVIAAAVGFIILMKKKKSSVPVQKEVKTTTLHEYMTAYPDGMGMHDSVALLLPVALQLRDLHNNGNTHLQVSPNSIFVGADGAFLQNATSTESDRYISGYAAPEIYQGVPAGNLSDIYSFCAILSFVSTGKTPKNALLRSNDLSGTDISEYSLAFDNAFNYILHKGMGVDPHSRFDSMQEIILKISPYNVKPFATKDTPPPDFENPPSPPETVSTAKRPRPKKAIAIISVVAVFGVLIGAYFGCCLAARGCAEENDFTTADSLLFFPQLTKLHDPVLVAYVEAGQLMEARQYQQAKALFDTLPGCYSADELSLEADYRYALQLADANDFDSAIDIMKGLSGSGYKDAASQLMDIQYRKGLYLLYEEESYSTASTLFGQLAKSGYDGAADMQKEALYLWAWALYDKEKYIDAYEILEGIRGYSDVNDVIVNIRELVYLEGQILYYEGKYPQARDHFECISFYADSQKYLTLITAHTSSFSSTYIVDDLIDIFYFEDAADLLLSKNQFGIEFLRGRWTGDGYYLNINKDNYLSYNLPWFNYGEYYKIEDGKVLFYYENRPNDTKALFKITAITPDCIQVFCYKNSRTYTLYRQ